MERVVLIILIYYSTDVSLFVFGAHFGPTQPLTIYEHKHGQLKHLFHGKNRIVNQLLFNVDVSLTLQLLHPRLLAIEDDDVLSLLTCNKHRNRSNMTNIGPHTYIIGKVNQQKLAPEQSRVVKRSSACLFSRLYKNGILYYATEYSKACTGKRNNSICAYTDSMGEVNFGQIVIFVLDPYPMALLHCYRISSESLLHMGGHSCRQGNEFVVIFYNGVRGSWCRINCCENKQYFIQGCVSTC